MTSTVLYLYKVHIKLPSKFFKIMWESEILDNKNKQFKSGMKIRMIKHSDEILDKYGHPVLLT